MSDGSSDALFSRVASFSRSLKLSEQQTAVLASAARGLSRKEFAAECGCSVKTVEEHWRRVFRKSGYHSEIALLARILRDAVDDLTKLAAVRPSAPAEADGVAYHGQELPVRPSAAEPARGMGRSPG
jgi:DNA-binding CsgD family transcriptional regulator